MITNTVLYLPSGPSKPVQKDHAGSSVGKDRTTTTSFAGIAHIASVVSDEGGMVLAPDGSTESLYAHRDSVRGCIGMRDR